MFKPIFKVMCVGVVLFSLSACEDHLMQRSPQTVGGKTIGGGGDRPGGFKTNPGEAYSYPEVTYQEFIPEYELFAQFKCHAWRIEWPWIDDDYNYRLIPTVLSVNDGSVRSFNYLNNNDPQQTFNGTLSLYYNERLESARDMWDELDYTFNTPGYETMESVQFVKGTASVKSVQDWVTKRPGLFYNYWPNGTPVHQISYQEGEFIHFRLQYSQYYGGIRIVSMMPRIIEVYLAVPNN